MLINVAYICGIKSCPDILFSPKHVALIYVLDIRCTFNLNKSVCAGETRLYGESTEVAYLSLISVVPKQRHLSEYNLPYSDAGKVLRVEQISF